MKIQNLQKYFAFLICYKSNLINDLSLSLCFSFYMLSQNFMDSPLFTSQH